jgi:hypothetical protein
MYDHAGTLRAVGHQTEPLPGVDPEVSFRLALMRVRKLLGDYLPGMSADAGRLQQTLALTQTVPFLETERVFALGWVTWLLGDWPGAERLLSQADGRCRDGQTAGESPSPLELIDPALLAARSAYWLARVRLLLGKHEAISEYETAMRRLGGSPQATAWYVDLLWRSGRIDRAEQVWKSVRANKRVLGCDEGPLLDARSHLRRGELAPTERLLVDARPASGVVWVERYLLLAWAQVGARRGEQARQTRQRASEGPYPACSLAEWGALIDARLANEVLTSVHPPGWLAYVQGQEARAAGQRDQALEHYRAALANPSVQLFAAYALACLGQAGPSAPPGTFFAARTRLWQAIERFRTREADAAQVSEAFVQAAGAGVDLAGFETYRQLVQSRSVADLAVLVSQASNPAIQRNALRLAIERVGRLSSTEARAYLVEWAAMPIVHADDLRQAIGRCLARLAFHTHDRDAFALASPFLPSSVLHVGRVLLDNQQLADVDHPAVWLWQSAHRPCAQERSCEGIYRSIQQSLDLVDASRRMDVSAVFALIEDLDAWQEFSSGPPRFVLAALGALVASRLGHSGWRRVLSSWLQRWKHQKLGPEAATLAGIAGLSGGQHGAPPAGVDAPSWFLHQAARALLREDASAALAFVARAREHPLSQAGIVEAALPTLERHAEACALARCVDHDRPAQLVDLVDLLRADVASQTILATALRGEADQVREQLGALSQRTDLPGRLFHHLALIEMRLARTGDLDIALRHGQRAWNAWLSFLASADGPSESTRGLLLDHLIGDHRLHINEYLSRDDHARARIHWQMVMQLPRMASYASRTLAQDIADRVERFGDELATAYLLTTREAMRFGDIPEGWRSDYERGLSLLNRLLSLDVDNVRLLTALIEICNDWFLDLYHLHDRRLFIEVERFTPPAQRLAELAGDRSGNVTARSALSEYWKFRGFAAGDLTTKIALYQEAMRFNPGNDNVRELLDDLEKDNA